MSKPIIGIAFVMVVVSAAIGYSIFGTGAPAPVDPAVDALAQCLTDREATFFGAFWCPHCQEQKKLFGSSIEKVKYVECSTPDGKNQIQACKDKGINSYPTWEFADGSRLTGEQPLESLAVKASCPFGETSTSTSTDATTTPLQS